ncbi:CotH kinase family protein [Maribacter sp. ANRC-HE7]|uniref:CotH kinase family protein n=1 Tax=Maribacter aquimaris TaxID=2737171 RepID=A0ABR7V4K7_9FLAO|nr:CotH kinase family protein [Maribacter aquimaris]MBD0778112.1 CotH kinase family protein [Maribacter aquimaris]
MKRIKKHTFYYGSLLILFSVLTFLGCSSDDGSPMQGTEGEEPGETIVSPEDKLPLITIRTNGAAILDEPKIDAEMTITTADVDSYTGKIGIEIRGASSQMFPKKSYGMETRDADNEDYDVSLFGFPEEEDWIFYGPYSDKTLVRNKLIYDLSREIDVYASRTVFAELNINDDYQGVYVFMEKLKRDGNRIDINKLKDDENSGEDLTGGYILKIDKTAGSNLGGGLNDQNSFTSSHAPMNSSMGQTIDFLYEYPDAEDITPEQKVYISDYVNQFENALASEDFADPELGYAAYMDVDSFIDFFLLNEISNNVDGYRLSTYMYKDKNEKLKMGPIWDFNLAFGNADYCSGGATNVWAYKFNERCSEDYWQVPFWWDRLLQDPVFVTALKARWNTLRGSTFSTGGIHDKIDGYVKTLKDAGAIASNFEKWDVLGTYVWPNNYIGNNYDGEISYLKNWIDDRLIWLDGAIDGL